MEQITKQQNTNLEPVKWNGNMVLILSFFSNLFSPLLECDQS
ncbi:MAG: hypothetical protein ACJAQ1_000773, partial [Flavobacterium sp.]